MTPEATSSNVLADSVLLVSLITSIVALPPVIIQLIRLLRRSNSAEELRVLREVAEFAVYSIEQTMKAADNAQKLDAALRVASEQLAAYKIKVTPEQLRAMVEAAVLGMKAKTELPKPPSDDPSVPVTPVVGG